MALPFEIGKKYNFKTLAPEILGDIYDTVEVVSILNASMASNFRDIYTLHEQLKSIITTLPIYANDCTYIVFTDMNNQNLVLALEWIDIDSIAIVDNVNIRLEIKDLSTEDVVIISNSLKELGYTNFELTKI